MMRFRPARLALFQNMEVANFIGEHRDCFACLLGFVVRPCYHRCCLCYRLAYELDFQDLSPPVVVHASLVNRRCHPAHHRPLGLALGPRVRVRVRQAGATRSHSGSSLSVACARRLQRIYHQPEHKSPRPFVNDLSARRKAFFLVPFCIANIAAFARIVSGPTSKRAYRRLPGPSLRAGCTWIAQRTPFTSTLV